MINNINEYFQHGYTFPDSEEAFRFDRNNFYSCSNNNNQEKIKTICYKIFQTYVNEEQSTKIQNQMENIRTIQADLRKQGRSPNDRIARNSRSLSCFGIGRPTGLQSRLRLLSRAGGDRLPRGLEGGLGRGFGGPGGVGSTGGGGLGRGLGGPGGVGSAGGGGLEGGLGGPGGVGSAGGGGLGRGLRFAIGRSRIGGSGGVGSAGGSSGGSSGEVGLRGGFGIRGPGGVGRGGGFGGSAEGGIGGPGGAGRGLGSRYNELG